MHPHPKSKFLAIGDSLRESAASLTAGTAHGTKQAFLGKLSGVLGNKLGVITAVTLAAAAVSQTKGAIVMTAADVPASQALGAAQDDTVWYKGSVNGNTITGSGTLVRGQDSDWIITAAHNVRFPSGTLSTTNMTIGNGTSYINDLGLTSGVSSMYISPSYVPGSDAGQDYAFLRLDTRISSPTLVFTLGSQPQYGASILFAGYGLPSSMQEGSLPNTGNVMGFWGGFSPAGPAGWNSADDAGSFTGQHDSGVANGRDSGGSVKQFNTSTGRWENIGTIIGSDFSSSTIFFGYNNADQNFNDYLANTVQPVIPETGVSALLALGGIATAMSRRRNNNQLA